MVPSYSKYIQSVRAIIGKQLFREKVGITYPAEIDDYFIKVYFYSLLRRMTQT